MAEYNAKIMPEDLQGKIDYLLKYGELTMKSRSVQGSDGEIKDWWNVAFTFGWFSPDYYTHTFLGAEDTDLECALHDIIADFIEQYSDKLSHGWWDD